MSRIAAIVLLVLAVATPAFAQVTRDDIDRARRERNAVAAELDEITSRYEEAVGEEIHLRESLNSLAAAIAIKERELALLHSSAVELARNMYMDGGSSGLTSIFLSGTFDELPVRSSYFDFATERDREVLARYRAVAESYEAQQQMLGESFSTQEALVAEISVLAEEILTKLEAADREYRETVATWERQEEERRRREEEARRRAEEEARLAAEEAARSATSTTAASGTGSSGTTTTTAGSGATETTTTTAPPPPPPITTDGKTCPVNGATSFSNSWGAPRSGGRSHKGVDMIAARGTPLVAIESGVIERTSNSSLGGISLYMRGASGDRYYYAHLDGIASGISGGVSVSVGQEVGYNGSSGNAPSWLPHLHFQWAPAGSDWVNPYPLVADLCR